MSVFVQSSTESVRHDVWRRRMTGLENGNAPFEIGVSIIAKYRAPTLSVDMAIM